MLTAKQEKFVQELNKGKSQREAYKLAGYKTDNMSEKTIDEEACKLLKNPKVSTRYEKLHSRILKESEDECIVSAKDVLRRWHDTAYADPNELIQHRRVCCRHCFGIDNEYQWADETEYQNAVNYAIKSAEEGKDPTIPSNDGGYGFDETIRPHPKCPKCKGEGYGQVFVTDTRDLSPQGKALYAGVKQTSQGFEIKMRDQDKALENIARYLGMYGKDTLNINTKAKLEDYL